MNRSYELFDLEALQYKYKDSDRICDVCEAINGPKCDTKGNMCEGRWCGDAIYYLIDDMEDEELEPFLIENIVAKAHFETYGKLLIRRR